MLSLQGKKNCDQSGQFREKSESVWRNRQAQVGGNGCSTEDAVDGPSTRHMSRPGHLQHDSGTHGFAMPTTTRLTRLARVPSLQSRLMTHSTAQERRERTGLLPLRSERGRFDGLAVTCRRRRNPKRPVPHLHKSKNSMPRTESSSCAKNQIEFRFVA